MLQSLRTFAAVAVAAALSTVPVGAADYPSRPITLVVGLAAGGGTDASARLMGEWLSRSLGQRVIIENRPGMGGNLGAQSVIKAPPDGHTLLFAGRTTLSQIRSTSGCRSTFCATPNRSAGSCG